MKMRRRDCSQILPLIHIPRPKGDYRSRILVGLHKEERLGRSKGEELVKRDVKNIGHLEEFECEVSLSEGSYFKKYQLYHFALKHSHT